MFPCALSNRNCCTRVPHSPLDPVLIVHANVKEPYSLLSYPFTTNHNLRGDDCELVMATVRVSGSSVHVLPLEDDGYEPGFVLVLQNALCLLSKWLEVWPMEMELPGCSTTKNL